MDITGVVVNLAPLSSSASQWEEQRQRQQQRQRGQQRWTVTNDGTIVAMPPLPSHVSSMAANLLRHQFPFPFLVKKTKTREVENALSFLSSLPCPLLPPLVLVRSVSSCSSSSSILDGMGGGDGGRRLSSLASISLESPPRMTRSFHPVSLFHDSDSNRTSSCASNNHSCGSKKKKMRKGKRVPMASTAVRINLPVASPATLRAIQNKCITMFQRSTSPFGTVDGQPQAIPCSAQGGIPQARCWTHRRPLQ